MERAYRKKTRWSNHEEEVVRQYLKVNPDLPIKQAAKELAILIDRSPGAISTRMNKIKKAKLFPMAANLCKSKDIS